MAEERLCNRRPAMAAMVFTTLRPFLLVCGLFKAPNFTEECMGATVPAIQEVVERDSFLLTRGE